MGGFLDRVPPAVRHLVFACASVAALAVLQWVQVDGNVSLPPVVEVAVAAVIPVLIAALTPITRQYGVGSDRVGEH